VSLCRKLSEQALYLLLDRALPDGGTACAVTGEVSVEFGIPELDVGGRPPAARAVVAMPEAAVNKDGDAVARKHDVGRSRQVPAMQAVSIACGEKRRTDGAFGAGVLPADCGHHPGSDGCGNLVCHVSCRM
jgi:hypothetical protein